MAFNAKDFLEALETLEVEKGISKEQIIAFLEESLVKGYRKDICPVNSADMQELDVRAVIDLDKGYIDLAYFRKIVDEVLDDYLEITLDEAKQLVKDNPSVYSIIDNELRETADINSLRRGITRSVQSMMRQKFAEVEKVHLEEEYKGKIGTIITGKVEKSNETGVTVNIGKTSVLLPRKELIDNETFKTGENIRLYVRGVSNSTKGGAKIEVSRADVGFLRVLLNEEITEIYNGTIQIKSIVREAGKRSKVAVYSSDINVDPAGSCIGSNGTRIQRIVGQLGNGQGSEKIDVITWSENPGLFIVEALKPAKVLGVKLYDEHNATAVVPDDQFSLAIGKAGVNIRLACKLTGRKIDIMTETDALEDEFEFVPFEQLQAEDLAARNKAYVEQQAVSLSTNNASIIPGMPDGYVNPFERKYEDEDTSDVDAALEEFAEKQEEKEIVSKPVEEVKVAPAKEEKKVEAPIEETKTVVKTTTSLEELEKNLEKASNKGQKQNTRKSSSKKKKEEEEVDNTPISNIPTGERMSIYTEEELAELEAEESEDMEDEYEDEVDYDEYDEYYDDDDR